MPLNIQVLGVIIAMVFIISLIGAVLYFTRNLSPHEKVMFIFVLIATGLLGLIIVDSIVAIRTELLSEKEHDAILQIMRTIVELVLGFYFGSKFNKENN